MGTCDSGPDPIWGGIILLLPVWFTAIDLFGVAGGAAVSIPAVFVSDDGDVDPLGMAGEGMYRVSMVAPEVAGRRGTRDGFRRGARVRSGEHGHGAFPVSG